MDGFLEEKQEGRQEGVQIGKRVGLVDTAKIVEARHGSFSDQRVYRTFFGGFSEQSSGSALIW